MAYNPYNLSALNYANGFTLWTYRSPDSPGVIMAPGYFNAAAHMLRVGDFVFVNAKDDVADDMSSAMVIVVGNSGVEVEVFTSQQFVGRGFAS